MAFCKKCGNEVSDGAQTCPHCGETQQQTTSEMVDRGGFGWGLLGCCVPIVGLILFLVWRDTKPKTAKAAGIGALVCTILMVIYYILIIALGIGAAFMV